MRNQYVPLFPADVIARAGRLDVPLPLDKLKATKIEIPGDRCAAMEVIPVEHGMKVVGTAMTVEMDDGDNFPVHVASYNVKEDSYVMVTDGKGYTGRTCFEDLIVEAYQATGFKGMVIDGCTRDRDGNVELGFPVCSRGFMLRESIRKDEGNISTPIMRGGVRMEPGDLMADDSGSVCVVPREYIETVLSEVEKKLTYEEDWEKAITVHRKARTEGRELPQLAPQWVLDMLQAE